MSTGTSFRALFSSLARDLQDQITRKLASIDGCSFKEDDWTRPGGGGGRTRVLLDGGIFEKAGVNFSEVHGELSKEFAQRLGPTAPGAGDATGSGQSFYATGISLVLHPRNPRVPTVHANFRYIEKGATWWIGGGADLTPYRLYAEDAVHFHRQWKRACDRHDPTYYPRFKKWCDEYFFLAHRKEARGIGGIFFDDLSGDPQKLLAFWKDAGETFLEAYVPILERRKGEEHTAEERSWQLMRRGRYVEFNLLYDRGTVFGLKTGGRIESILMSLPPIVHWGYDPPEPSSGPEAELLDALRHPRDWIEE